MEGKIVGPRMTFQWRRHQATGKAWMEQSPDGKQLIGRTIETDKPSTVVGIRTSEFQHHQNPVAGKTIRGISDNGMLYHLRMPDNWDSSKAADVIVLLHGSNFTTAGMVSVVASQWPDIAKRFAILGIQGERWTEWSTPKDLRFNYTYVNWMGRSTYKGFPFTDRESPSLVVDVIDELDKLHSFGRVFVGGHSQGGFLTYILHMHFPEKLAGTFPIAGGMPIQSDPKAFDDNALMVEQRKTPMVIIHGTRDAVVNPSMSAYAHQSFRAHDFHLVKRLRPEAGHPFDFLPINDAIHWLDVVTSSDPTVLAEFAAKQIETKSWRDVGAVVQRAKVLGVEEKLRD
jgi:predicted esterase